MKAAWFVQYIDGFTEFLSQLRSFIHWFVDIFSLRKHYWSVYCVLFHQIVVEISSSHDYLRLLNLWCYERIEWWPRTIFWLDCCDIIQMLNHFYPFRFIDFRVNFNWFDDFAFIFLLTDFLFSDSLERVEFILLVWKWTLVMCVRRFTIHCDIERKCQSVYFILCRRMHCFM